MLWLVVVVLGTVVLVVVLVRALWSFAAAWRKYRLAEANRCEREVPGFGLARFDGQGTWSFQIPFGDRTLWAHVSGTKSSPSEFELISLVFARAHLGILATSAFPKLNTVFQEWGDQESAGSAALEGISTYPAQPGPAFGLCFSSAADPDGMYEVVFSGLTPEMARRDD